MSDSFNGPELSIESQMTPQMTSAKHNGFNAASRRLTSGEGLFLFSCFRLFRLASFSKTIC